MLLLRVTSLAAARIAGIAAEVKRTVILFRYATR